LLTNIFCTVSFIVLKLKILDNTILTEYGYMRISIIMYTKNE